ncbi:MAG: hypothetical protein ACREB8_09415 [Pseudolabrys sp.]
MPTAGLSLFAFMTQQDAVAHLLAHTIPANPDVRALIAEWQAAQLRRGAPMPAGHPDIKDIPAANQPHIDRLMQQEWMAELLRRQPSAQFKLVEIDPLLTIHFMADLDRSMAHCNALRQNPSVVDLLPICLPAAYPNEHINVIRLPDGQPKQLTVGSLLLTARSLNVRVVDTGFFQAHNKIGVQFGMPVPLVHVVRFNGRCYLHDGLHRTMGARRMGATHIPCLLRDVQSPADVGLKSDRSTFTLDVLESADAPTVGHFTQGRACEVQLKRFNRVIHVTWAEYAVADE